ncbi:nitronate monooxygenase [Streptomyces cirratus]
METELSKKLGVEHAIFGFTPFPRSPLPSPRAGGFGVLGAVRYTAPDDLKRDLDWLQAHTDGKPYGLDVVMPAKKAVDGISEADIEAMIPAGHRAFVRDTLAKHHVPELAEGEASGWRSPAGWNRSRGASSTSPSTTPSNSWRTRSVSRPPDVIRRAHDHGVLVAALAGSAKHARRHAEAGIDVVVAQGYEAGGHTGDIATMVLVPEIAEAVAPLPVLAAGGIGSGEQIAAGLALGAQGVWLGSLWLTTTEADLHSRALTAKLLAAGLGRHRPLPRPHRSSPPRQLRTEWYRRVGRPGRPRRAPPCRSRACWSPKRCRGSRSTRSAAPRDPRRPDRRPDEQRTRRPGRGSTN